MKIETVPLSELHEDPKNVRVHSRRNMDAISNSLSRFGQQKPLVITHDNMIVAGNGTFQAATSLGWSDIAVVRLPQDWSQDRVTAFAIADNRTSELGEWDYGTLVEQLGEFESDLVLAAGWDDAGLKFLLDPPSHEPQPADANADIGESYEEAFEHMQNSPTRSVLFDFPLEEFLRVTRQLEKARVIYNADSNSEVVKLILQKHMEEE